MSQISVYNPVFSTFLQMSCKEKFKECVVSLNLAMTQISRSRIQHDLDHLAENNNQIEIKEIEIKCILDWGNSWFGNSTCEKDIGIGSDYRNF